MAKKKTTELTLEEKLEQALVPNWDVPYKLPDNWCWVNLENVSEIIMGQSPEGSATTDDPSDMPLIGGAADMGELYPKASRYTKAPTKISKAGDIILCVRATLGRPVFSDGEYCLGRGVAAIRSSFLTKEYLRYVLVFFEQYLYDNATGTTFAQISSGVLKKMPFPLPTLAEQQRIVDRIESLFAKLDEAKEKAQAVVDGFEDRKAAILHKAFSGELTAEWHKENDYCVSSWEDTILGKVLDVRDGTHDSPQYYDEGFPLVTSKNLKNGKITDKDLKLISKADYEKINERSKVNVGDVLFAMIGTIGNPVVVEEEPSFAIKNVALFKNIGKIDPYFVKYYLESKTVIDKMEREAKGSTQKFVSLGYLRSFPIKKPPKPEQRLIVKFVDRLLGAEIQAKEAAEQVIDQIDAMKKSILARAFRGELATNDPNDENAVELLKRILEGHNDTQKGKKSTSRLIIPKNISEQLSSELEKKIIKSILKNDGKADINAVMSVSSKKFDVMDAIKKLEDKNLIIHDESGEYILKG